MCCGVPTLVDIIRNTSRLGWAAPRRFDYNGSSTLVVTVCGNELTRRMR